MALSGDYTLESGCLIMGVSNFSVRWCQLVKDLSVLIVGSNIIAEVVIDFLLENVTFVVGISVKQQRISVNIEFYTFICWKFTRANAKSGIVLDKYANN